MSVKSGRVAILVTNSVAHMGEARLALANRLLGLGYQVTLVMPGLAPEQAKTFAGLGFRALPLKLSRKGLNPLEELASLLELYRLYPDLSPALVHHFTIKPVLYGTIAARLARVPRIMNTITGLGYVFGEARGPRAWLRRLVVMGLRFALGARGASQVGVIFQNPDDQEAFLKERIVAVSQTTTILGSGVDLDVFTPSPEAADRPVILFPARMLREKGVEELIAAGDQLASKSIAFEIWLAGSVDLENPSAIEQATLESWVSKRAWLKWLGHSTEMPALYRKAHIVCLPSFYREGVPRALIEGAASGRPLVTTNFPGCRETVESGVNGFLVPKGDVSALANALEKLLTDRDLRQRMGVESRRLALEKFGIENILAQTVAFYSRFS